MNRCRAALLSLSLVALATLAPPAAAHGGGGAVVVAAPGVYVGGVYGRAYVGGYGGGHGYRGGPWGGFALGLGLGLAVPLVAGAYGPPVVVAPAPMVVAPPPVYGAPQPVPLAAAPVAPEPIFYPRQGQDAAQLEADRQACNRWATTQPAAMADASVFHRATLACMDGRGYSAR